LRQRLIDVWAGVEQSVIDDAIWPVAQMYPYLRSSYKRTVWIFIVAQISQNLVNCNKYNAWTI